MDRTPIHKKGSLQTPRKIKSHSDRNILTPKKTHNIKFSDEGIFKVLVSVRVRPPTIDDSSDQFCLLKHSENEISVKNNLSKDSQSENMFIFSYDHIFWFHEKNQRSLFQELAIPLLNSSLEGYNVCLFAYGQTGSGKTYSLMDADGRFTNEGMGIIPRFCHELLQKKSRNSNISIQISYYEIYNEKIYDLLRNDELEHKVHLKVREHPLNGPYVADLTVCPVNTFHEALELLMQGNRRRVTGTTLNNDRSSRSHAILDINLTLSMAVRSKIRLVDLAGSERASQCNITEERFKEGLSINKSLLTLGKVITALSEEKKRIFVPYRESLLTWLLKDCLGGQAKTCMLATVSPQAIAYEETLSTLRWANKAKNIVCVATKNEDPQIRTIIELQNEVKRLQNVRDNMYSPRNSVLDSTNINRINLAEQQKCIENRLQSELAKLELHLDLAEKEKLELEEQRTMIIQSTTTTVPQYNSNFYESLKNILNSSLNDSITDSVTEHTKPPSVSSTAQLKQKYLNKMKHLSECLKSICQTEISLNNGNGNSTLDTEYAIMSEIEDRIYKIMELNL